MKISETAGIGSKSKNQKSSLLFLLFIYQNLQSLVSRKSSVAFTGYLFYIRTLSREYSLLDYNAAPLAEPAFVHEVVAEAVRPALCAAHIYTTMSMTRLRGADHCLCY